MTIWGKPIVHSVKAAIVDHEPVRGYVEVSAPDESAPFEILNLSENPNASWADAKRVDGSRTPGDMRTQVPLDGLKNGDVFMLRQVSRHGAMSVAARGTFDIPGAADLRAPKVLRDHVRLADGVLSFAGAVEPGCHVEICWYGRGELTEHANANAPIPVDAKPGDRFVVSVRDHNGVGANIEHFVVDPKSPTGLAAPVSLMQLRLAGG